MMRELLELRARVRALEGMVTSAGTRGKVDAVRFVGNRALLQVKTLAGEVLDGVELLTPFGVSGHPVADAEVVVVELLGRRDLAIALSADALAAGVPSLAAGELGIGDGTAWIAVRGDRLELHAGGRNVTVDGAADVTVTASGAAKVSAATIELDGAVNVVGSLSVNGVQLQVP